MESYKIQEKIYLKKYFFVETEKIIIDSCNLKAFIFKYESGVEAVRIENKLGSITILPYKGQQIWKADFNGRELVMKSAFKEPKNVENFVYTYGAFLMHCGALRMGCPGKNDTHPLHGELPYANYDSAEIITGKIENENFIGVTGIYDYNLAFSSHYNFIPVTILRENSGTIDAFVLIKNLSKYPMELMYMAHINFAPAEGANISQCSDWNKDSMYLRGALPGNVSSNEAYIDLIKKLKENPQISQYMGRKNVYDPEVVFYFKKFNADSAGNSYFMQLHEDGSADYVSFNINELEHGARWIVNNKDQQALGIILPSTCDADGYLQEKEKGNIKYIAPLDAFSASYKFGYLNSEEAVLIKKKIESINSNQ